MVQLPQLIPTVMIVSHSSYYNSFSLIPSLHTPHWLVLSLVDAIIYVNLYGAP